MRHVFALLVAVFLIATPARSQPTELRGVWITNVDSDVLFSRARIAEAMDYLASRGFNVVFPVVWNKGYTLYRSEVMDSLFSVPIDPLFGTRDPLAELIVEAHRNGIEVMPWFEFGFATEFSGVGQPPVGSSHIAQRFPEWMARDNQGQILKKNGFEWMNAMHPGPQEFLLSLIREVIENYDVDGIQGDDRLPAMAAEGGYSDFSRNLYAEEHGGAQPPSNPLNAAFIQWKSDKLTEYAGRVYAAVKEVDESLTVSFSPSVWPWSRDNYLQDWPEWLERGYVDVIHPQAYRWDIGAYRTTMQSMVGSSPGIYTGYLDAEDIEKLSPGLIIKAGQQFNDWEYVRQAVEFNRQYGIAGEVYFFYEGLREKNEFVADSLYKYFYGERALMPGREDFRRTGGIIVNETDESATLIGDWIEDSVAGYDGGMLKARRGSGAFLEWSLNVTSTGTYDVYAFQPRFRIDATRGARFVTGLQGDTTVTVLDQWSTDVQGWTQIARIDAEAGETVRVRLDVDGSGDDGFNYADAVMLLPNLNPASRSAVSAEAADLPGPSQHDLGVVLHPPYPHPTTDFTTISFTLASAGEVDLSLFDVTGRRVATLVDSRMFAPGRHTISADVSNLASGIYMYRARAGASGASQALVVLR